MTKYIGARYMPKFMGVYVPTTEYEALSVVDNGMGTSYVSNKPVPPGTDLTNTEYWTVYGSSSGAIINLQQQIDDINDDIADIENSVKGPIIRDISHRKFVFVGDSYTQVPTPTTSFVGATAAMLGIDSSQYHNIGVSGEGMSGFITQVNNYSYTDADDITDVIVTGGINDAQGVFADSTLSTTIPALITAIRSKFPNAVIWAGFSGNGLYPLLVGTYSGFTYDNVQNIKYLWKYYFSASPYVIYMDDLDTWYRMANTTDYFHSGSGLHPYGFGIDYYAEMLSTYLKGGAPNISNFTAGSNIQVTFHFSYSLWTGENLMKYWRNGNTAIFRLKGGAANLTSPITLTKTEFQIIDIPLSSDTESNAIYNAAETTIATPLYYTTTDAPSVFKNAMATFKLKDNHIYVQVQGIGDPIANVASLWYPTLEFHVPTNAV